MHETDAEPVRHIWRGYLDRLAIQQDLPSIGLQNAVNDMHQRRLSGTVFPRQRVDFAAPQVKCSTPQRLTGPNAL